jgi:hypothetical protein
MPVFIDSAASKEEIDNAHSILFAVASKHKLQFKPKNGVHGSSTLRADKDPAGVDENWEAITNFLRSLRS